MVKFLVQGPRSKQPFQGFFFLSTWFIYWTSNPWRLALCCKTRQCLAVGVFWVSSIKNWYTQKQFKGMYLCRRNSSTNWYQILYYQLSINGCKPQVHNYLKQPTYHARGNPIERLIKPVNVTIQKLSEVPKCNFVAFIFIIFWQKCLIFFRGLSLVLPSVTSVTDWYMIFQTLFIFYP